MKNFLASKRTILSFLVIILFIFFFWGSYSLQSWFYDALPSIKVYIQLYPFLYGTIFVLLAMFSAMLSPFSSLPLVPFAVLSWGKGFTMGLLLLGWIIGACITFSLTRYIARPVIEKYISLKRIDKYQKILPKRLEFWFLLMFRFSMPVEIPGYVLGLTKVSFWKYILATFIAELPFAVMSIYGSDAFLEKDFGTVLIWVFAGLIVLIVTFYLFYKKVKRK